MAATVAKDFSEGNVELVQGHQVTTETAFDSLGDVDGNGSTLETDTGTEDDTGGDDHAIVHSTRLKRTTNGVKNARDKDSPAAAKVFVARRDKESTGDSTKRHARVDQRVLLVCEMEVARQEQVGTGNK